MLVLCALFTTTAREWGFEQPGLEKGVFPVAEGLELDDLKVPSNQNHFLSYILCLFIH